MSKHGIVLIGFAAVIAYIFYKMGLLGGHGLPTNFGGTPVIGSGTPITPITDVPAGFQVAGGNESPVNSPVILSGLYVPPSTQASSGAGVGGASSVSPGGSGGGPAQTGILTGSGLDKGTPGTTRGSTF